MKTLTFQEILPYIADCRVTMQMHPEDHDLCIFNYTKECQYERLWDEVTLQCRGLIMNVKTNEIVARSLSKFFNYDEWLAMGNTIPDGVPLVLEKIDGMLGILYWKDGLPCIASRGSFASDYAIWATDWIRRPENIKKLDNLKEGYSYIFEIVYAESRIVLKYDYEELVWLGEVNTITGEFIPATPERGFRIPESFTFTSAEALTAENAVGKEGYVLQYGDLLLKIKFEEYKRLHKIMTNLSRIGLWEILQLKGIDTQPKDMVDDVPDEFFQWVEEVVNDIKSSYRSIEEKALAEFGALQTEMLSKHSAQRRDYAEKIVKFTYPSIGFAMLDNKAYKHIIFKMIRPVGSSLFRLES